MRSGRRVACNLQAHGTTLPIRRSPYFASLESRILFARHPPDPAVGYVFLVEGSLLCHPPVKGPEHQQGRHKFGDQQPAALTSRSRAFPRPGIFYGLTGVCCFLLGFRNIGVTAARLGLASSPRSCCGWIGSHKITSRGESIGKLGVHSDERNPAAGWFIAVFRGLHPSRLMPGVDFCPSRGLS